MEIEYFDDPQSGARPVLLCYSNDPSAAVVLQDALQPLVAGDASRQVQIDRLPGFHGVNGCSLIAQVASSNVGLTRIDDCQQGFRCALDPTTWSQVSGLLEPFTDKRPSDGPTVHQYLSCDGPIDWIIATSPHW